MSVCVRVHHSWDYLCDNSSPAQARITKVGPEVQNTFVKTPIVLGAIDLDHQDQTELKIYPILTLSKNAL